MVTPISSLISSGGLSICCATAEPSKRVTSSSLDRNGISSSSRLVASAFWKASVNLAERTPRGSQQFRQAGNISQKRSNGGDTFLPQHRFLVAMMVRFSSASLRQ